MAKQTVLDAFNNKKTDRVPAGFWFHFSPNSEFPKGPENPLLFQRTADGHKRYIREVGFDLLKIMTEGYFVVPSLRDFDIRDPKALQGLEPADQGGPWFTEQIELARQLVDEAGEKAAVFYNLFSPISYLSFSGLTRGASEKDEVFAELVKSNPGALKHALDVIAGDIAELGRRVLTEAGADGVFVSVRNYAGISGTDYGKYIAPSEHTLLQRVQKVKDQTILHICGESGIKNDFSFYTDYEAKAINWGTEKAGISLKEGKKLFGGKAVIGGFQNGKDGALFRGDRGEIERLAEQLVRETGRTGLILGADCALPNDINWEHLKWLRQKIETL
jgi:uroporphyrinogen decarboxylase